MKCPICGKELEIRNKQIGTNENGEPVFNEYAICRDCRKQWNLDKQRAKRAAAQHSVAAKKAAPVKEAVSETPAAAPEKTADEPKIKKEAAVSNAREEAAAPVKKKPVKKRPVKPVHQEEPEQAEEKTAVKKPVHKKTAAPKRRHPEPVEESPVEEARPAKKPVKKRHVNHLPAEEEQRYGNIPPEKVRSKHEKAARKSYEDMLATGEMKKASPAKPDKKKKDTVKAKTKVTEPETDEYDDEEYYDDEPRFRPMRIILGIISILGFGYFIYKGFITGLAVTSDGGGISSGTTFIVIALCMLVSALLYFIMLNRTTIFAFLLPMIFYLGSAVFTFLERGDDLQLLLAAIISAVLAVISLILAITSRGGYYEDEEDYDDPFEDDYADDDYDD